MLKKVSYILCVLVFLFSTLQFRSKRAFDDPVLINLKWHKAYESESWPVVRTGILWSLSYLGAALPKNSFDSSISFIDSSTFVLNLKRSGFKPEALGVLNSICDSIKNSEDYRHNNAIDLSRFLLLTLYSPNHYYKITGVETSLADFTKKYNLKNRHLLGVTASSVGKGHRLVTFSKDTALFQTGFLAEEGHGSLDDGSFVAEEFEAFDLMPNGQFRYAIYDKAGNLAEAANSELSIAGKIGKCMWCHETYVQPLFKENKAVPNMISNEEFKRHVAGFQRTFDNYRKTLSSEIDFTNPGDHTASELLYISFMEPSLYRLNNEFKKDSSELKKFNKEPTHIYEEFPFLGNLYYRKNVDSCFSYPKVRVPEFVREKSSYEPDYFKNKKKPG